jgi:penicillin amidase
MVRRLLLRLGLALGAAALLAVAALAWLALGSLPDYSGRYTVDGLDGPVSIARDRWAIPTIEATSQRDAYLALGFAHAQDRLWQMEMARRIGQGRLAEILGSPGLPFDRFMRTLGLYRLAEASEARLSADSLALLEAYARGVNAFLDQRRWPLPPEFQILRVTPEPWRVADSLVFARLMALELGSNWRDEVLRARLLTRLTPGQVRDLWPPQPAGYPVTLAADAALLRGIPWAGLAAATPPPVLAGLGSNVFAVSGARTASGSPLLASDPHLGLQAPGVWYLARLRAPGLEVEGGTMPSMPIVVIGRNRDIAWGMTTTGGDTQDLFIERVDPTDPARYRTPAGSQPFQTREERILVKGGQAQTLTVRETRHGPVLSDLGGAAASVAGEGEVVALAWTGLMPDDTTIEAGFGLAHATDWAGFVAALRPMAAPEQNVAFADRAGHVGMLTPGRVPIRKAGDGTLPVPGWTGAYDWTGIIPFEQLPRTLDPPSGRVVNANNRLVGPGYPFLIAADWQPALRARRIEALLDERAGLTLDDLAHIQLDTVSTLARDFRPLLLQVRPGSGDEAAMLDALRAWDGRMAVDRPEPLMFTAWYQALGPRIYGDELGPLLGAYRGIRSDFLHLAITRRQVWCDDVLTPAVETCAGQAALAWRDAVAALEARHGADWRGWRWGAAHPVVMAHRPFDQVPWLRRWFDIELPVGGGDSTVNVAHYVNAPPGGPYPVSHGPGLRLLADLATADGGRLVAATGQSGHPFSRHYDDLTRLWRDGAYVPLMEPAAEAGSLGTVRLDPPR